jgi:microcystin degradation protein MlrC
MSRPLRLAFGRINQETNALSPVLTTENDFRSVHWVEDDALLARCAFWPMEVESMFRNAELSGFVQGARAHAKKHGFGVDLVPLLSAWAVPSGPLTRACFDILVDTMCSKLRAALASGPLDGVYLSLHGAMNVEDLPLSPAETPESEIVRRVREVVGPTLPVAVSLDLHGLITSALVEQATFIQGYQTNPHRDHAAVGARCARVLADTARGLIAPAMAWRSLPMILGGGNTVDFLKPLRPLFQRMKAFEQHDAVLGTTLMTVHPWNRHPEVGWATLVAVDTKKADAVAVADRFADELAQLAWDVRHHLPPTMRTAQEALDRARRRTLLRKTGVIVISDASDVTSAGAPGENTALVKAFVEARDLRCYTTLRDPVVVDQLFKQQHVGDKVDVVLGGKLDPVRGVGLPVHARIERLGSAHGIGRHAVLAVDNCRIVVVEGPAMAVKPLYYKEAGLDPWKADVVMVKNFFPFLLFFAPLMRDVIFVRTAGVTDLDAAFVLDFAGPVHPRDRVDAWQDTDRRRRALRMPSSPSTTSWRAQPAAAA